MDTTFAVGMLVVTISGPGPFFVGRILGWYTNTREVVLRLGNGEEVCVPEGDVAPFDAGPVGASLVA